MGACRTCGKPGCRGYRLPGLLRDQKSRGYVWACVDHIADAEAAWEAAKRGQGVSK